MLYRALRSILFSLDPEVSHDLSLKSLSVLAKLGSMNPLQTHKVGRPTKVMGISFPNRVGLAAGLDKNGAYIDGLSSLGFGFLEIGTVTPKAQHGNPKPRLFRIPEAQAIINRMGFNNNGVDALIQNVSNSSYSGILGINIGKNKDTPVEDALSDYLTCLRKVYSYASYVTINISSPNTPGLRSLQNSDHLNQLLKGLATERMVLATEQQRHVPLVLKIAPDLKVSEIEFISDAISSNDFDGIIATNTTSSRIGVDTYPYGNESGGMSGRPVFQQSTEVVKLISRYTNQTVPIIACGGILDLEGAQQKLDVGASLVQVYSGFIYRGPKLVCQLIKGLT